MRERYYGYIETLNELMEEPNNMSARVREALTEAVLLFTREAERPERTADKVRREGFR